MEVQKGQPECKRLGRSYFPFFSLHGELRNYVYRYCSPLTASMRHFRSLLLVSKQFRHEYLAELQRLVYALRRQVRKTDDNIFQRNNKAGCRWYREPRVPMMSPANLAVMHLKIQLPVTLFSETTEQGEKKYVGASRPEITPALDDLLNISVYELTIVLIEDNSPGYFNARSGRLLDVPLLEVEERLHLRDTTRRTTGPQYLHIGWQVENAGMMCRHEIGIIMAAMHFFWDVSIGSRWYGWTLTHTWMEERRLPQRHQMRIWSELQRKNVHDTNEWKYWL